MLLLYRLAPIVFSRGSLVRHNGGKNPISKPPSSGPDPGTDRACVNFTEIIWGPALGTQAARRQARRGHRTCGQAHPVPVRRPGAHRWRGGERSNGRKRRGASPPSELLGRRKLDRHHCRARNPYLDAASHGGKPDCAPRRSGRKPGSFPACSRPLAGLYGWAAAARYFAGPARKRRAAGACPLDLRPAATWGGRGRRRPAKLADRRS